MDRTNRRRPLGAAGAACCALVAAALGSTAYYGGLASWPLFTVAAMVWSGATGVAVAAFAAKEAGKWWPWPLIAAAAIAVVIGMQPLAARLPAELFPTEAERAAADALLDLAARPPAEPFPT